MTEGCPIKGVSVQECIECSEVDWESCGLVKVWQARMNKKGGLVRGEGKAMAYGNANLKSR